MQGTSGDFIGSRIGRRALMAVAGLGAFSGGLGRRRAIAAETTIRWLHLELNPKVLKIWNDAAAEFHAAHPGVEVKLQFLENEAFKAKLPTLLQSPDAPSTFYSWGGGVLEAQSDTGALRPIDAQMDQAWRSRVNPSALTAFTYKDHIWGAPHQMAVMGIYYNKSMFAKAGLDGAAIKTWDQFLAAVTTLKAAGLTPITVGGGDKWPIMHWWAYLVLRAGGKSAVPDGMAGKNGGFVSAPFIEGGRALKQLVDLRPFQEGFMATNFSSMLGQFGDGRAAMTLSFSGTGQRQAAAAADGKGLAQDNVGLIRFPALASGKGLPTDTMGGLNAWLVSRNAPPQTTDFLNLLTSVKYQTLTAATGVYLPAIPAANGAITDPLLKQAADELAHSTYHQNYFDQDLGPDVGRVLNDQTAAIATGNATPEQVAQRIQDAWTLNR